MHAHAVPPSKMSKSIKCEAGVAPLPDHSGYSAFVSWQGKQGTRYEESLGVKHKPWFAGVAHDVALCARAYHAGDRQLRGLQRESLNFPLSCYINQSTFWKALDMSFGQLALTLRTNRDLEKDLFFGNDWQPGLWEERLAAERQEQQAAEPQRQQQHEAAAPARQGQQASSSLTRSATSKDRQQGPPRVAVGPAPTTAGASQGATKAGQASKPDMPLPPAKQRSQADAAAAADTGQQQPQARSPSGMQGKALVASQPSAHKPASAGKSPAAAGAAAAAAGLQAAPGVAGHVNGGSAASTSSDEELPLSTRKQRRPEQQHGSAAAPAASPSKRSQQGTEMPAKAAAAQPASPRAAVGPQLATPQGQQQQGQQAQQQQQAPQHQAPQQPVPPRPGKEAEPKTVWAKPAEFPPGSGKYPLYLKEGPLSKGYFTVANEADIVLLGRHEGAVTLRDAATGRTWPIKSHLKRTGASESRYLTATTAFNRENELRPHDVLWLSASEPRGQQLLFGVWRWGSPEAAAFQAHLCSGKPGSGKKRTRAQLLEEAAAAGGDGGRAVADDEDYNPALTRYSQQERQQREQPAPSSGSSEDRPLVARRPQHAGKSAIEELFDD